MISANDVPLPDFSILFFVAFLAILFSFVGLAIKFKAFRPYTLLLIPIGIVELYLPFEVGGYHGNYKVFEYIAHMVVIALASIISGITFYPLSKRLYEKKQYEEEWKRHGSPL